MKRSLFRAAFGLLALALMLAPAQAADEDKKDKASEADIKKAKEEVKKLAEDLEKLNDQVYDARRKLGKAVDKLDELEGRPAYRSRFGRDFRDFRDFRRPDTKRPDTKRPDPAPKGDDVEKRLERLMKELEDLRKDMRKSQAK